MVAVCLGGDSPGEDPKSRGSEREPLGSFFGDRPLVRLHEDHECSIYVARDDESNLVSAIRVTRYPDGIETPSFLVDPADSHEQEIVTDSLSLLGVRSVDDLFEELGSRGLVRPWEAPPETFGQQMVRCVRTLDMDRFVSLLASEPEFRLERFDGLTQASFVFKLSATGGVEASVRVSRDESSDIECERRRVFNSDREKIGFRSLCLRVFREEVIESNQAVVDSFFSE